MEVKIEKLTREYEYPKRIVSWFSQINSPYIAYISDTIPDSQWHKIELTSTKTSDIFKVITPYAALSDIWYKRSGGCPVMVFNKPNSASRSCSNHIIQSTTSFDDYIKKLKTISNLDEEIKSTEFKLRILRAIKDV
jgi:hypothetical protein